jgi:16S rRNA (cytidine1402-2'-O)-methyltransferase
VATPIGNLADVTQRALEVLGRVEAIAAEDTRVTRRLLERYGLAGRLLPVHEHNEKRAVKQVLMLLAAGKSVALVSDAGTPGISDPGTLLVAAVRAAGYAVTPVPGPNAAIAALSASGLAAPHFLFYGFLPERAAARRQALSTLATAPYALVFYEAPHRVQECIADLGTILGSSRQVVIARELTKLFETVHVCALGAAGAWLAADANRRKGEFVLIVEGASSAAGGEDGGRHALEALLAELPLKQAVGLAARITGARKNTLYRMALAMGKRRE